MSTERDPLSFESWVNCKEINKLEADIWKGEAPGQGAWFSILLHGVIIANETPFLSHSTTSNLASHWPETIMRSQSAALSLFIYLHLDAVISLHFGNIDFLMAVHLIKISDNTGYAIWILSFFLSYSSFPFQDNGQNIAPFIISYLDEQCS